MCYSTRTTKKIGELEDYYEVERLLGETIDSETELIHNHANGWAHPNMWILPQQRKGFVIPSKWGIMPATSLGAEFKDYFAKNRGAFGGLNLRCEDIFKNYMYEDNIYTKRCVIPVDGFFEPHTTAVKVKGKPFKVPFYFKRADDKPMSLAGIYNVTNDKMVTFSIFTNKATPLFEDIHNQPSNKHGDFRRPVVLQEGDVEYWLEDGLDKEEIVDIMDNGLEDAYFDTWPISKDLHKRNGEGDRPDIIDKVEYEEIEIRY
ncbi:SOS response-associated peptidase [Maribacter algarum]|uniref:Abasic site processing protein n=1 Tax=Maribacter algarum (ex Zhang et al. 2020) TaxID=2578118 RepID=A0A5S3PR66_9FLAO|nr:SOS response-associated peptidase family protein [Maribacter algarum]TMM57161.1 SOS response-associated peptidase [Maribacter algarum]